MKHEMNHQMCFHVYYSGSIPPAFEYFDFRARKEDAEQLFLSDFQNFDSESSSLNSGRLSSLHVDIPDARYAVREGVITARFPEFGFSCDHSVGGHAVLL